MLRDRQRAESNRGESCVAPEGFEHLHERMALLDLRLAIGAHDERGGGREPPRDVLERLDRKLGAVQLFEDEDERLLVSDARECPREELEDGRPVLGLRRAHRARLRRGGPQLADFAEDGEEREQIAGEVGEVGARRGARAGVLPAEVVLDQLAEPLMSERAILLHEAALQDADLPGAREARQLLDEPALPDSGFARHDRELAFPGHGRMKPPLQLGDLLLAPDERGGRRLRSFQRPAPCQHHGARVLVLVQLGAISAQRFGQVAGPLRPLFGVLLQALEDDRLELLADVGSERPQGAGKLVGDAVEHGLHFTRERRLSREALIEDCPQRIRVRPAVEAPRCDLLRAEVRHGAHERPGLREAVLGRCEREAEVHHARANVASLLAGGHDVLGLDVAVDDAAGVAVVERVGDLHPDVEDVAELQRAVAEKLPKVRVRQHRHDEEERPVVPPEVVDRHD